jgi:hypothetical protein
MKGAVPKLMFFTVIHLWNALFFVPITRYQWIFSFRSFLKDEIYASVGVYGDNDRRAQARHRKDGFKN